MLSPHSRTIRFRALRFLRLHHPHQEPARFPLLDLRREEIGLPARTLGARVDEIGLRSDATEDETIQRFFALSGAFHAFARDLAGLPLTAKGQKPGTGSLFGRLATKRA